MTTAIGTAALLIFAGLLVGNQAAAAEAHVAREADKAHGIKRILARRTFYSRQPGNPFCRQLLEDFRELNEMSFVEPVARAKSYDDPVLGPYKSRCGELPLNEYFACDPRSTQGVKWSKDPRIKRKQLHKFCRLYSGTVNFKVFELDIDNDSKNGIEIIFYSERAAGRDNKGDNVFWNGGYNVFKSSDCAQIPGVPTNDPYSYFWNRPLENYNGILFYRGRYYIFDLSDLDPSGEHTSDIPHYSLHVSTVGPDRPHWCSYSTIPPKTQPNQESTKSGGSK